MSRVLTTVAAFAHSRPTEIALSGARGALSWWMLRNEIEAAQTALTSALAGYSSAAPVAVALDNGPAWAVIDLALVALGRPSAPLPPFFTRDQVAHAMRDCGAALLLRPAIGAESPTLTIAGAPVVAEPMGCPPISLHAGTAKITYTSGSTGRPKGVCLSQAQMESVAAAIVEALGHDLAGVHMPVLPLGVLLENVGGLYASVLAGGRYHAPDLASLGYGAGLRPDPARLADQIDRHGVTSLILTPELLRALAAWLVAERRRLDSLDFVAVGGARISSRLVEAARAAGLPAYEGYGLSECGSVVTLNTPRHDKPGSAGRPLPHLALSVAADGEIVVGPRPFLGYVGGPPQDGPVATGDLGTIDADGFIAIRGRKSNLIVTAFGRNVAPEWVESELQAQPEIAQAAVFGDGAAELCALITAPGPQVSDDALAGAVARANTSLPVYAQVGRWRRSPPFEARRGELTDNGRLRRAALRAAHADFIDAQSEDIQ